MRLDFDPGDARRGPGNAALSERGAEPTLHEASLVLRGIPDLHDHEMAALIEPGSVSDETVRPVPFAGRVVDAEHLVDRGILGQGHAFKLQYHCCGHVPPPSIVDLREWQTVHPRMTSPELSRPARITTVPDG